MTIVPVLGQARLPIELVELVLSFVNAFGEGRVECLRNCALVCWAWTHVARKELFSTWSHRREDIRSLGEISHLTQYVGHLRLETVSSEEKDDYPRILPHLFPNITHISVTIASSFEETAPFSDFARTFVLGEFLHLRSLHLQLYPHQERTLFELPDNLALHEFGLGLADPDQILTAVEALSSTNSRETLLKASFTVIPVLDEHWERFTSSVQRFSALRDLDLGRILAGVDYRGDLTPIHGTSLCLSNLNNLVRLSLNVNMYRTLGSPACAPLLASLLATAQLPSLRFINVILYSDRPKYLPEPGDHHCVYPFGRGIRDKDHLKRIRQPILAPSIASQLERFAMIFKTDIPVIVEHGTTLLSLLGVYGRANIFHIEANGHEVVFAE